MKAILTALSPVLVVLACGGESSQEGMNATPMAGHAMTDMAMPSLDLLPAMRARADSLRTVDPNAIRGVLADHVRHVETMLSAMAVDMGAMSMTGDAAWQALDDSVRADLVAFAPLDGEALVLRARAHAGRLRRLMAQHEMMMAMDNR